METSQHHRQNDEKQANTIDKCMNNLKGGSLADGFKTLRERGWQHCAGPHLENPAGEGGSELLKFILTFVYQNALCCSGRPSGRFGRPGIISNAMGPDSTGDAFKDEVV